MVLRHFLPTPSGAWPSSTTKLPLFPRAVYLHTEEMRLNDVIRFLESNIKVYGIHVKTINPTSKWHSSLSISSQSRPDRYHGTDTRRIRRQTYDLCQLNRRDLDFIYEGLWQVSQAETQQSTNFFGNPGKFFVNDLSQLPL